MIPAVIAVPFFDTPENGRAVATSAALMWLYLTLGDRHTIVPVDNGSTDKSAWNWCVEFFPQAIQLDEPHGIAHAVNLAWSGYHDALMAGEAIAVKHDSDLICNRLDGLDGQGWWVEDIVEVFCRRPDVWIMGPRNRMHGDYKDWIEKEWQGWIEAPFVYGGIQARSPACFSEIGYSRQPSGRWGWADHWDTHRVKHAGKKLGVLWNWEFFEIAKKPALEESYRKRNSDVAVKAFGKLQEQLREGEIPLFESFDSKSK